MKNIISSVIFLGATCVPQLTSMRTLMALSKVKSNISTSLVNTHIPRNTRDFYENHHTLQHRDCKPIFQNSGNYRLARLSQKSRYFADNKQSLESMSKHILPFELDAQLPIGIQTFRTMEEQNFIYVDKTQYIYNLIRQKRYYFLSRPRRFGKSLLISTLEEIFSGNKELFAPYFIYTTDFAWHNHPVITINFADISAKTPEALEQGIEWKLTQIAKGHNLDISDAPSINAKLESLIAQLSTKNSVVLLIDEYDYPILTNIDDSKLAKACRDILRNFYATLKGMDKYLRCIFVTGVAKFSKTSVFSGLNNLQDLTLDPRASQLLGYTENEIVTNFRVFLEHHAKKSGLSVDQIVDKLRYWYNGYQFSEPLDTESEESSKVYNPFSVLLYLSDGKFLDYWFETGTPTFLMQLIKAQAFPISQIEGSEVNVNDTTSYDIDKIKLIPLLWQTGYLTIESYDEETKNYKLRFPNEEVKTAFLKNVINYFANVGMDSVADVSIKLKRALISNDYENFFEILKNFLSQVPYTVQLQGEKSYHLIFYVILKLIGADVQVEIATNIGRIDAIIESADSILIFEFKLDGSAQLALNQIKEKKYYQKYLQTRKKLKLFGVNYGSKERNINEWVSEDI